jgi:hypothetical protein
MPSDKEKRQIGHARAMFDNYIAATASFTRHSEVPGQPGRFHYSEETVVTDMLAFSKVYMCVWEAIENGAKDWYRLEPNLFTNLRYVVTPHPRPDDTRHVQFWVSRAGKADDIEPRDVRAQDNLIGLADALRNGFGHFHYRYRNMTPEAYFNDLGLRVPPAIQEPQRAGEFDRRIFILDGKRGGGGIRIVETTFAHLRYHLACFLARFFTAYAGAAPYTDILTGQKLTPHAEPFR